MRYAFFHFEIANPAPKRNDFDSHGIFPELHDFHVKVLYCPLVECDHKMYQAESFQSVDFNSLHDYSYKP